MQSCVFFSWCENLGSPSVSCHLVQVVGTRYEPFEHLRSSSTQKAMPHRRTAVRRSIQLTTRTGVRSFVRAVSLRVLWVVCSGFVCAIERASSRSPRIFLLRTLKMEDMNKARRVVGMVLRSTSLALGSASALSCAYVLRFHKIPREKDGKTGTRYGR